MSEASPTAALRSGAPKGKNAAFRPAKMGPLERAVFRGEKKRWEAVRGTTRFAEPKSYEQTAREGASADEVATKLMLAKAIDESEGLALAIRCASPVVICEVANRAVLDMVAVNWKEVVLGDATSVSKAVYSTDLPSPAGRSEIECLHLIVAEPPKPAERHANQRRALAALSLALPVIAFSPLAASHLPDALLRARDVMLSIGRPDADTIGKTVHLITGSLPRAVLDESLLSKIDVDEIALAVRFDRSAADCMDRLKRLALAKIEPASVRQLRLDDLHGMDEAVTWAKAFVADVAAWRRGTLPWSAVDAGAIFEGPPGTAKSTLLRVISAESGVNIKLVSLAKWQGSDQGHLGTLLRAMHADVAEAKSLSPCILGCEEVEAFGDRKSMRHDWKEYSIQVVDGFLAACDSLSSAHDFHGDGRAVALIGTTNDASRCDPAILRSGRFNRVIRIGLPDRAALEAIFRLKLHGDLAEDDLGDLPLAALGSSGADVERMVKDARRTARQAGRGIVLDDLKRALAGGFEVPEILRPRYAAHEAAHVLVDVILHGPLGAVAVMIASGSAAASTFRIRTEPLAGTHSDNFRRLQVMLAGRAGERELHGEAGWGAGTDLHDASVLAAAMVGSFGNADGHPIYLGPAHKAEDFLKFPDVRATVRRLLAEAGEAAARLVAANRAALEEISARLLAGGRIEGHAVAEIIARHAGEPPNPSVFDLNPERKMR